MPTTVSASADIRSQMTANEHIHGFDWLRAVFSVAVVVVHLGYLSPSLIFDRARWPDHVFAWSDAVNFYGLLLAVPVFVMMSCFLLAKSPQPKLGKRIWRIGRLFVFWGVLLNLFQYGVTDTIRQIPKQPLDLMLYLASGFRTPFYFFFSLMIMLALTAWAQAKSTKIVTTLLLASIVLVGFLPVVARFTGRSEWCHIAMPLNYIPYPFAAVIALRVPPSKFQALMGLLLAAGLMTAILDWSIYIDPLFFGVNSFPLPTYARPSLVFLAVAVVVAATRFDVKPGWMVKHMSEHSLALYCLHPFALLAALKFTNTLGLRGMADLLTSLVLILILSYSLSYWVLPHFFKRELFH
ncbi:MAG: acyltransferase family protein [Cyanobacteriota bacterium]|nr:acyltransferase family protein [Cyanobacteriota bacterium]